MKRKRNKLKHNQNALLFMAGDGDISSVKKIAAKTDPQKKSDFHSMPTFLEIFKRDKSGSMATWPPHAYKNFLADLSPVEPSGKLYDDPFILTTAYDLKIAPSRVASKALVSMELPEIKITGHGILALRKWRFINGWLKSEYKDRDTLWKEQMIANYPPNEYNDYGLYGTEFSSEGLMRHGHRYSEEDETDLLRFWGRYVSDQHFVSGIIQMRGKIINHENCILKAEWARIVCIFVPVNEKVNEMAPALIQNYPNTPVYVLHHRQIAEVLFRTLGKRRKDDDEFSG